MWLITTHMAVSSLLYISSIGFKNLFKERLQRFKKEEGKKTHFRRIKFALIMFVPLLNVLVFVTLLYMIGCTDEQVEVFMEKSEK